MILSNEAYLNIIETMPVVCIDGLIINEKKQFLLVKRANEPLKNEFWMPGGRLHKNEKCEDGIKRKILQELNAEVEIIKCLGHFEEFFEKTEQNVKNGFHAISIVFLLRLLNQNIKLDEQSMEWIWTEKLPMRLKNYNILERI